MHDCIVFIDSIYARQIVHVKEIDGRNEQRVNRIVMVQHRLLLLVPVRLQRLQTDIVEPVAGRFEPHHLNLTVSQFVGQIFVVGNLVARR